jgi:hypothetical protein
MIASMYSLDHRLNELRPSERDLEIARRLRDAALAPRTVVHTLGSTAGQWLSSVRIGGQSSRLAAG